MRRAASCSMSASCRDRRSANGGSGSGCAGRARATSCCATPTTARSSAMRRFWPVSASGRWRSNGSGTRLRTRSRPCWRSIGRAIGRAFGRPPRVLRFPARCSSMPTATAMSAGSPPPLCRAGAKAWRQRVAAAELPAEFDPPRGFVVSANERPPAGATPIGWFFSPPDRALRLAELLGRAAPIGAEALRLLQQDVLSQAALALRDRLLAGMPASPLGTALARWDGRYETASEGALAFELLLRHLVAAAIPPARRRAYAATWNARRLFMRELAALAPETLAPRLAAAAKAAAPLFRRYRCWGGVHRLQLSHPFAALPGIRRRWRFVDWPWPGGDDTVFKTSHGLVGGPHAAGYGSNARYIFDLSDPDANDIVLLGGQDGVPGSAAFLDQAALFRDGRAVRVPLTAAAAHARFPHRTRLEPAR